MLMMRLIYFSRQSLDQWYDDKELGIAEILAISVANNQRDGITGALISDDCWFVQALEGGERDVSTTFERILRDRRHRDVSLVTMEAVAERRFPDFAMVCVCRNQDNGDLFRHYGEDDRFDPRQIRRDRLSDLIEAVVRHGPTGGTAWTTKSATSAA
jgi:Sensors of blue-light using FAD